VVAASSAEYGRRAIDPSKKMIEEGRLVVGGGMVRGGQ
jgi:hypothetical protein